MHRNIAIIGALFLLVGTLGAWRLIERVTPPENPRDIVTIPEGWSVTEINKFLGEEGVLVDGELPQDLEGYLFPDTYEFFLDSTVEVVKEKFLGNLKAQLETLEISMEDPKLEEVLILASLIQEEIKDPYEMRVVAGILKKRLEMGIPLQIDATLCYIKEKNGDGCLPVTKEDKALDSLYNTYLHQGLPPSPISNPGLDAIKAALNPANSPYLYYVSDPETGKTIFGKTLDEHNQNVIKYLSE
ncbi:MAG: hypothetical protein A2119_03050 [Candidatus Colwellbacteria bacterium GWA2_46_10]|uniref:Endolytic murein transglycosylase n=1 Tax=Candidatus Colwellbacteria bacterium GWA2_46_10 TaxID=1797684 RepID=A0A1G1YX52_9BACT|nr:MAG: hypothetical protein A2119_03050 [Candidatus Colwellbacteria bacterium GWA2_46_10]